tara:strand:- start:22322 stop:22771 length:450 start_codon:yes stop_codon:yes gene_type:complete
MNDEMRLQLLEDISLLIKEGIGIIYTGDGRWVHSFDLIFSKYSVNIEMSFDLEALSISVYEGGSCNTVTYENGEVGFEDFILTLKSKFSLDTTSNVRGFLSEMEIYKKGDLENLQLKLDRFIKKEKFEEADKVKLRMNKIEENNKKRKK